MEFSVYYRLFLRSINVKALADGHVCIDSLFMSTLAATRDVCVRVTGVT
jgi:hypothetical protein